MLDRAVEIMDGVATVGMHHAWITTIPVTVQVQPSKMSSQLQIRDG